MDKELIFPDYALIEVVSFEEQGKTLFTPCIVFFEESKESNDDYFTRIALDMFSEDYNDFIKMAYISSSILFTNVDPEIKVFSSDGEIIEVIDLSNTELGE
jgi:hypothetical protein